MNIFIVSEFDGLTVISCSTDADANHSALSQGASQTVNECKSLFVAYGGLVKVVRSIIAIGCRSLTVTMDSN
jgi:hypothetical protein